MTVEKPPPLTVRSGQFLNKLRAETSYYHIQLEQLPLPVKITSEDVTLKDYTDYLQRMLHIHQYIEHSFFPLVKSIVPDINKRKKSTLITDDLNYLKAEEISENRFNLLENPTSNVAFAAGVMYVIEGSTLGGRFILKNVHRILQLDENNGAKYFAGYRSDTGMMWKSFLHSLGSYQTQANCDIAIINGAIAAFKSIFNYMQ